MMSNARMGVRRMPVFRPIRGFYAPGGVFMHYPTMKMKG